MKHTIALLLLCGLCLAFAGAARAQSADLRGQAADEKGAPLVAATVALLQAADSVLLHFAVTDAQGAYAIRRIPPGRYLLQISYVGYHTHWQALEAGGQAELDAGLAVLRPLAQTLATVEVKAEHSPISISGDTLNYNANAFKVQPGDVVEDLLKRLPGVEVENDGTVKVQGETVQNVLVDGKEFFGSDTRIATQNLPADAVDKVQVFDKASDIAEFTGIEDGREEKTINLKLKEGKKHGHFGQADLGGGSDGRYQGRFNLNRFSPETRLSAIGMANNTNQQSFSIQDYIDFMGGIGSFMSGGGGRFRVELGGEAGGLPVGGGPVSGVQTSWAGGLNLNRDFSARTEFNGSYFFSRFSNDLQRSATRENLLADGLFVAQDDEDRSSLNLNHRFTTRLKHRIDSFQQVIVRADGGLNDALLDSRGYAATYAGPDRLLQNDNQRDFSTAGLNYRLNGSAVYQRRFRQPGRALVASVGGRLSDQQRDGQLSALNRFANAADTLRQRQDFADTGQEYSLSLTYTEPLGRRRYLQLSASRQNFANETRTDFFDQGLNGETPNDQLSRYFRRGYTYDRADLAMLLNREKFSVTAGLALQHTRLNNRLPNEGQSFNTAFTNLLPSLRGEYEFSTGRRLNVEYQTLVQEPAAEQLQPIVNNADPLNIYVGNPNLRPEYTHQLDFGYFLYDQFTFTNLFLYGTGAYTAHRIAEAAVVDSLFRRTLTPVNTDRELSLRAGLQFSTPIRPLKVAPRLRLNTVQSKGILFVNDVQNDVVRSRYTIDLGIENRNKEKIDLLLGYRRSENATRWSVSDALNQQYNDEQWYAEASITPSARWALGAEFQYTRYSEEAFGQQLAIPLWQLSLTRYVLAGNRGRIRLTVFDLLNRNNGISRSSQLNFVEEERYNVLGRYFLLSFGYSLSGFDKKTGGIEIKMER